MLLNCGVGRRLESPLHSKKITPVNPKGNQSWIFVGRTDAEGETPILWPPDAKDWLIGKDPDAGKTEGRRKRGQQRRRCLDGITTQWTWTWVSSGSWWWTEKPGVLQSMRSQRIRHNWATELNWGDWGPVGLGAWLPQGWQLGKSGDLALKELPTAICLLLARTGTLGGESCALGLCPSLSGQRITLIW